jgi:hypothetical protein
MTPSVSPSGLATSGCASWPRRFEGWGGMGSEIRGHVGTHKMESFCVHEWHMLLVCSACERQASKRACALKPLPRRGTPTRPGAAPGRRWLSVTVVSTITVTAAYTTITLDKLRSRQHKLLTWEFKTQLRERSAAAVVHHMHRADLHRGASPGPHLFVAPRCCRVTPRASPINAR